MRTKIALIVLLAAGAGVALWYGLFNGDTSKTALVDFEISEPYQLTETKPLKPADSVTLALGKLSELGKPLSAGCSMDAEGRVRVFIRHDGATYGQWAVAGCSRASTTNTLATCCFSSER